MNCALIHRLLNYVNVVKKNQTWKKMRIGRGVLILSRLANHSAMQVNGVVLHTNSCGGNVWVSRVGLAEMPKRNLWCSVTCWSTDKHNADEIAPSLSQYQAYDMIHKLTAHERQSLKNALNQYESDQVKSKFQGKEICKRFRWIDLYQSAIRYIPQVMMCTRCLFFQHRERVARVYLFLCRNFLRFEFNICVFCCGLGKN